MAEERSCFIIMPISDVAPYPEGHFSRVYRHIIEPACHKAGFTPVLASDVKETNLIVLDILQNLYTADLVLCDLSARNPNVLFELGFRQAFNKPAVLIRDSLTGRIFDISGLRDIEYDPTLRIDSVETAVSTIAERIVATFSAFQKNAGINSLVQLLGVNAASVAPRSELSFETQLLLESIAALGDRLDQLSMPAVRTPTETSQSMLLLKEVELELAGPQQAIEAIQVAINVWRPPVVRLESDSGQDSASTILSILYDPVHARLGFEDQLTSLAHAFGATLLRLDPMGFRIADAPPRTDPMVNFCTDPHGIHGF